MTQIRFDHVGITAARLPRRARSASRDAAGQSSGTAIRQAVQGADMTASERPGPGSRPVRVFVSSTFQDMHAERDHLNCNVWPELRDRCLRLGVDFIAVDLRWGVTREDAERQGAVAVCLAEIARCDYFVGLLGDRYGWAPPPDTVPEAHFLRARSHTTAATLLDDCYELDASLDAPVYRLKGDRALSLAESDALVRVWERSGLADAGQSITELEVRRALQTVSAKRSMFYVRDVVLGEHGARFAGAFQEADEQRRERQAALRAHVIARKGLTTRSYRATFAGIRLSSSLLPEQLTRSDRRSLADGVIEPAELKDVGTELQRSIDEFGTAALDGLEAWGERVQDDLWAAVKRDIGAAPMSTSPVVTVRSLCEALRRHLGARRQPTEVPHDPAELFATFSNLLAEAAKAGLVVVMIDALDQLDADGDAHDLPWLPVALPDGAKVIVSALAGDALDQLRRRVSEEQVLVVGPMTDQDRTRLASELLGRRSKRLMPDQLQRLLDPRVRPDAVRPLYITVAVEELSLFGRY